MFLWSINGQLIDNIVELITNENQQKSVGAEEIQLVRFNVYFIMYEMV